MRIRLDKIASSTRNVALSCDVRISDTIPAQEGTVIAVRVLQRKDKYNELEDIHGRFVKIKENDILAGVLGSRKALRGYAGSVPKKIQRGDILSILNLGGIIGKCDSSNSDLGDPLQVEVLGSILTFPSFEERIGIPAHIRNGSVAWADQVGNCSPIIYVSGTCMNTGKTTACAEIIRELSHRGYRVAAAKLTGISLLRDTLQMKDSGAVISLNFTDAGVASTATTNVVPIAKGILKALHKANPDIAVVELGDGLAGEYGVQQILKDKEMMTLKSLHIVCASDPIAAWGAYWFFKEEFHTSIHVISGPVTDNGIGKDFVRNKLDTPAWNARTEYQSLTDHIEKSLSIERP